MPPIQYDSAVWIIYVFTSKGVCVIESSVLRYCFSTSDCILPIDVGHIILLFEFAFVFVSLFQRLVWRMLLAVVQILCVYSGSDDIGNESTWIKQEDIIHRLFCLTGCI